MNLPQYIKENLINQGNLVGNEKRPPTSCGVLIRSVQLSVLNVFSRNTGQMGSYSGNTSGPAQTCRSNELMVIIRGEQMFERHQSFFDEARKFSGIRIQFHNSVRKGVLFGYAPQPLNNS